MDGYSFQSVQTTRVQSGAVLHLNELLAERGLSRPLFVTDAQLIKLGVVAPAIDALQLSADTVVIFDRVRENLRRYKSKDHYYIYNKSINETLSRTVITSVTTLIALFIIFFFGGAVLSDFALAMIWGVLIGTFSSIFVAVSILTFFDINKGEKVEDQSNVPEYERDN